MAETAERGPVNVWLRPGQPDDAEMCGPICYDAFSAIAGAHGFPNDYPSAEVATALLSDRLRHPGVYSVVAEAGGSVVGSAFMDERSSIAGIGPVTVALGVQNQGIGRLLMEDVLRRAAEQRAPGVRLLQTTYHNRSLSLYTKLGFQVRELVACVQGAPVNLVIPGHEVRAATAADIADCDALCMRVHGHHRHGEVSDSVGDGACLVVEHHGRLSGYSTGLAFGAHSVGETNEDLKALIGTATEFLGPGILVPASNTDLFNWCLAGGLRIVELLSLMTIGLYNQPAGSYLPSILY
jgi:predicted N-acetyltransferase YhbS